MEKGKDAIMAAMGPPFGRIHAWDVKGGGFQNE